MKIFFLLVLVLSSTLFGESIKVIEKISDLPKQKDILLVFSMNYCPYCIAQEETIVNKIKPKFPDIEYYKVKKNMEVFDTLIHTGNFGEVEFFPTTFILKVYEDGTLFVKYPFKGYQRADSIIRVLNDQEIMQDF